MKYIKKFESFYQNVYYKGDYVFLVSDISEWLYPYAKIIKRYKDSKEYYVELLLLIMFS